MHIPHSIQSTFPYYCETRKMPTAEHSNFTM